MAVYGVFLDVRRENLQMVLANYRKSENTTFQHAVSATSLKRLVSSSVSFYASVSGSVSSSVSHDVDRHQSISFDFPPPGSGIRYDDTPSNTGYRAAATY